MSAKFNPAEALSHMDDLLSKALYILNCPERTHGWTTAQYLTLRDTLRELHEFSKCHNFEMATFITGKVLKAFQNLGPTLRDGESADFSELNAADLTAPRKELVAARSYVNLLAMSRALQSVDPASKLPEMRLLKRFARFCGTENRARVQCVCGDLKKDVREMRKDPAETAKSIRWLVCRTILSVFWDGFCRFIAALVPIAKIINKWRGL